MNRKRKGKGKRLQPSGEKPLPEIPRRQPKVTLTEGIRTYTLSFNNALIRCSDTVSTHSDASGLAIAGHVLMNEAKDSNVVFSPLSLNVVLSLIAAGAKGETLEELLLFLKSGSADDVTTLYSHLLAVLLADGGPTGGPRILAATGVWIQKNLPLKDPFRRVVEIVYKATCLQLDFISRDKADEIISKMNSWVEKQTNGLIREVLRPGSVNELTRLIIANTLYFKGEWGAVFDVSDTKEYDFHLYDGSSVKAPFMTSSRYQLVRTLDGFKVLGLPYRPGENELRFFTLYIFLPDSKDGLPDLEKNLLGTFMNEKTPSLDQHLPHKRAPVNKLRVPKFKISFELKASKTLNRMGMRLPFIPGGLTEMVDSPAYSEELFVGEIYHKSCIEVNEQGTEAASVSFATGLIGSARCVEIPPEVDFVADHPFMFLIREDTTGVVLFIGHVLNPLQE